MSSRIQSCILRPAVYQQSEADKNLSHDKLAEIEDTPLQIRDSILSSLCCCHPKPKSRLSAFSPNIFS